MEDHEVGLDDSSSDRGNTDPQLQQHQPPQSPLEEESQPPPPLPVGDTTVFDDLYNSIVAALQEEETLAKARGETLTSHISVQDLHLRSSDHMPETTLWDVLESWKQLMTTLQKHQTVYTEYVDNLDRAFVSGTTEPHNLRHIQTLLTLLTQSVQEHGRDPSIECRFVTLLEVLLSYNTKSWSPSDQVAAFWVRLMQRIPQDIAPVPFRRKAYRVLVSLSWVPSSKGLLAACSFEESRQVLTFPQSGTIPQHMQQIRGGPLPRFDSMNQLLDRLKDETDVCVAITSEKQGLGKTTLAGQVASHPSILRVFAVVWLNMKGPNRSDSLSLNFATYIEYLKDICEQLELPEYPTWPVLIPRFEEPTLRRLREQLAMKEAKQMMSEVFQNYKRNILLVMDDVRDAKLLEWFRFSDRQSVIVTTPDPDLAGLDWALELVPMSRDEAVELFLKEACLPVQHILGTTVELRAIIDMSDCNPLTVRAIARWFQLKQVTAGRTHAILEIVNELNHLSSSSQAELDYDPDQDLEDDDPNMRLFDVLSLIMGPTRAASSNPTTNGGITIQQQPQQHPSVLFVLCFAALVTVFPDLVPLDAVILLWEQVLKTEALALEELTDEQKEKLNKHAWLIAEGLLHMGVIDVVDQQGTAWVQAHHALYRDFAILMARELNLKDTPELTVSEWHLAFVTGYFSRKTKDEDEQEDGSWVYTIEKLPSHMFKGKMIPTAEIVLGEENFFRARMKAMSWHRGIKAHIEDCVLLQHEIEQENELNGVSETKVSNVFKDTASMLREQQIGLSELPEEKRVDEHAQALYMIGFALAENGYFEEAMEHFEGAEELSPRSNTLQASIFYVIGWCYLEMNQPERAKNKINVCRKMMDQGSTSHGLYKEMQQLYADALVETCAYKEAYSFFETVLKSMMADRHRYQIEVGTCLYRQGRLCSMMGNLTLAKKILNDCINWKIEIAETSRSLAEALGLLGDIHIVLNEVGDAKQRYEAAQTTLDALLLDANHLDYRLLAGKLQHLRHDFKGCRESFELVRRTSNESPLKFLDQSAYDLRMIARIYEYHGDLENSAAVLRESLLLTKEHRFSLERAWGEIALGNCLVKLGDGKEALICYEQAHEIQMVKLGETTEVLDTANLIGNVLVSLGEMVEASALFRKNYEAMVRIAPDDTERLGGVLYLLGDACEAKESFSEAASYFRECVEVLKRDRSDSHPDIAKILQRLGNVTAADENLDKAMDYYQSALKIRRLGFDDRLIADTVFSIGVVARKRGDFELARASLDEALEFRKKTPETLESSEVLLELGNVYRMCNQAEKAMEAYSECLQQIGDKDVLHGDAQMAMGHVKLSMGDYSGALTDYECVRLHRLASYGKDSLKTGNSSRSLGLTKFLIGRSDEAMVHLNEFARVCKKVGEEAMESVDMVLTQLLLGDIYDLNGLHDQARVSWSSATEIYEGNSQVKEALPILVPPMFERRVESGPGSGFLSRRRLQQELEDASPRLDHDPEELVLQKVLFVDD